MTMTEILKELGREYIAFICSECGVTETELFSMDDDALYDRVYDPMCDIECEETPVDDGPLTQRGEMAEYLVTVLGNTLAVDDDEDDPPSEG